MAKDLDKNFLSVVKVAPTYFVDEDFRFGHVFTPIVGTSTIEDQCSLLGDFGEHSLKGLLYKGWRVCHSRRDLKVKPIAWYAVNSFFGVFLPLLSVASPAAPEWGDVIKYAFKSKSVRVSGHNV
jgi:hypothetical protein